MKNLSRNLEISSGCIKSLSESYSSLLHSCRKALPKVCIIFWTYYRYKARSKHNQQSSQSRASGPWKNGLLMGSRTFLPPLDTQIQPYFAEWVVSCWFSKKTVYFLRQKGAHRMYVNAAECKSSLLYQRCKILIWLLCWLYILCYKNKIFRVQCISERMVQAHNLAVFSLLQYQNSIVCYM
jgi:hypothetical protein